MKKLAAEAWFPALLLAARYIPFDRLPSTCLFSQVFHLPCPSCGMTRSVMAVAHLDFRSAVGFHPMGPVLILVLAVWWVNGIYQAATGRSTTLSRWTSKNWGRLLGLGVGMILVFGIARICLLAGWF